MPGSSPTLIAVAEIGGRRRAIADGYIPETIPGSEPEMTTGHDTVCVLNAGDADAQVSIHVCFWDREPAGPYRPAAPARRTRHIRFNDLREPEPIAPATDFSSVIDCDVPIVVHHPRLDSRQPENALPSTMALGCV